MSIQTTTKHSFSPHLLATMDLQSKLNTELLRNSWSVEPVEVIPNLESFNQYIFDRLMVALPGVKFDVTTVVRGSKIVSTNVNHWVDTLVSSASMMDRMDTGMADYLAELITTTVKNSTAKDYRDGFIPVAKAFLTTLGV